MSAGGTASVALPPSHCPSTRHGTDRSSRKTPPLLAESGLVPAGGQKYTVNIGATKSRRSKKRKAHLRRRWMNRSTFITYIDGRERGWQTTALRRQRLDCLPIPFKATQTPTTDPLPALGTVTSGTRRSCAVGMCERTQNRSGRLTQARVQGERPMDRWKARRTTPTPATRPAPAAGRSTVSAYKAEAQASVTAPTLGIEGRQPGSGHHRCRIAPRSHQVNLNAGVRYYSAGVVDTLPRGVVAPTAGQVSIACTYTGDDDPTPTSARRTSSFLTEPPSKIGWAFGDVRSDDRPRTIAITYTSRVADVPVTGLHARQQAG